MGYGYLKQKGQHLVFTAIPGSRISHPKGRLIKFDEHTPDFKLSTGSLKERVIAALEHSTHPLTSKEIADRIGSSQPRASSKIRQLIDEGVLAEVKLDGCLPEYILANDPNLTVK